MKIKICHLTCRGPCSFSPGGVWGCHGKLWSKGYFKAGVPKAGPFLSGGVRSCVRCVGHFLCLRTESAKPITAAGCCPAEEGPRVQLCAWLRVLQGSDPLVSSCRNRCREQLERGRDLPADSLGKGLLSFSGGLGISRWKRIADPWCGERVCVSRSPLVGSLYQAPGKRWTRASLILSLCFF